MNAQAKLRVVESATIEDTLAEAFAGLAEAEQTAARFRAIIAEEGRALWAQRNPGQRLFGHLRFEQIRQMVAE